MPGDLAERVARTSDPVAWALIDSEGGPTHPHVREVVDGALRNARAAVREVLAAMREPRSDALTAGRDAYLTCGGTSVEARVLMTYGAILDAFAREHGLEPGEGP